MDKKFNGNGKNSRFKLTGKSEPIDFKNEEVNYPVTYNLKAIMDATRFDDDNKNDLVSVFKELNIIYIYIDKKISSKGTYVSFTYKVTLTNKEQMYKMYAGLRLIKALKFAL